ncbi:MAG: DUF58 domain-containing protein [Cellvibrionaceae bacterium]
MRRFKPSPLLLYLLLAFAVTAIGIAVGRIIIDANDITSDFFTSTLPSLWWGLFILLACIATVDCFRRRHLSQISGERILPHYLALNRECTVTFIVKNHSGIDTTIDFIDVLPEKVDCTAFPLNARLDNDKGALFDYVIIPRQRGDAYFGAAQLLIKSSLGLWTFIKSIPSNNEIKVYPDFSIVNTTSLLSVEKNMSYMGAHLSQKLGDGTEFQQLREFRIGDTLKQIDWKATARLKKPISREYQEEKDQNIIFMLDCSRRMRTQETNLTYFDHALNALLVNSYIALSKGDAVGFMTFSGDTRWSPPLKGKDNINQLLNQLYHVNTSTDNSDYIQAAEALLNEHRKRSLIILMTNLHEEDSEDILLATTLLTKHHLVMVVSLQEHILTTVDEMTITDTDSALLYAGAHLFAQNRNILLSKLKNQGAIVVDATHQNMHMKLLHEYLQLKRSGRI